MAKKPEVLLVFSVEPACAKFLTEGKSNVGIGKRLVKEGKTFAVQCMDIDGKWVNDGKPYIYYNTALNAFRREVSVTLERVL